jgi:hypothetical protein
VHVLAARCAVGLAGGTTARLLEADHHLFVPGRADGEAILGERTPLDRGALEPPRLGLAIGHGAGTMTGIGT